jgi:ABC transporter substrate binding protein
VLAGAVLAPLEAGALPVLPVIGYLSNGSAEAEISLRNGLLDGLKQQGFIVGRNVAIEYRFAEANNERVPSLAAELIGLPAAVMVAYGLPAVVPAKKATASIPIVFALGFDPVQLGLVASFNRPAGYATGVNMFEGEVISKRLELLREVLPQPGLIAYLVPGRRTPAAPVELRQWKRPPKRSDNPCWFCAAATRMKSRRRSRQWPNARSAVFFSARPSISR